MVALLSQFILKGKRYLTKGWPLKASPTVKFKLANKKWYNDHTCRQKMSAFGTVKITQPLAKEAAQDKGNNQ